MIGSKLSAYIHANHERHMTRTDQSIEEYLRNGGWVPAPDQDGKKVWKDPDTGSSFLEPEALRRQDSRPFEDKVIQLLRMQAAALDNNESNQLSSEASRSFKNRIHQLEKELDEAKAQLKAALTPKTAAAQPHNPPASASGAPVTGTDGK